MIDNNETGLHDLSIALQCAEPERVKPIVADVSNQPRLETIFELHRPQVVFHAAAYKHVPMMEHHPDEAVRVNILGTAVVAELTTGIVMHTERVADHGSISALRSRVIRPGV